MIADWERMRRGCLRTAQQLGCTADEAEDVAQETLVRVLEYQPEQPLRYAQIVAWRLAIRVRRAASHLVGLESTVLPLCESTQEATVYAQQLGFRLRLALPHCALEALDDAGGSAGRMRRFRARGAVREALDEVGRVS